MWRRTQRLNAQRPRSAYTSTPRTLQRAALIAGPDHASTRAALCHSHVHASGLVNACVDRGRVGGSRFLQVDPVEGGSANDYDYVAADPINKLDLDGQVCWSCGAKKFGSFVKRHRHTLVNIAVGAAGAAVAGACIGTVVCGLALGGVALAGAGAHVASDRIGRRDGRDLSFRNALGQSTVSAFSGGLCGKLIEVGCGRGAFAPSALRKTTVDRIPIGMLWLYSNLLPKMAFRN